MFYWQFDTLIATEGEVNRVCAIVSGSMSNHTPRDGLRPRFIPCFGSQDDASIQFFELFGQYQCLAQRRLSFQDHRHHSFIMQGVLQPFFPNIGPHQDLSEFLHNAVSFLTRLGEFLEVRLES